MPLYLAVLNMRNSCHSCLNFKCSALYLSNYTVTEFHTTPFYNYSLKLKFCFPTEHIPIDVLVCKWRPVRQSNITTMKIK